MRVLVQLLDGVPPALCDEILPHLPSPFRYAGASRSALSVTQFWDNSRSQADASRLVERLAFPKDGECALLIASHDLFVPALTYVFGVAHLGGKRAVVSTARLRPAPDHPHAGKILRHRLLVEAAHELGHSLGLVHCTASDCAMHRSLFPESIDLKKPDYCELCQLELLQAASP